MHTYDPQKAERVWKRVQGEKEVLASGHREDNLQELIMNEWESAATYLQLSRRLPPPLAAAAQRLYRQEQNHASALKGIYTLTTGQKPMVRSAKFQAESPEITLRKCYARQMRSLKEYETRSDDDAYGPVFARLAQQEREHCKTVLEMIGTLSGSTGG